MAYIGVDWELPEIGTFKIPKIVRDYIWALECDLQEAAEQLQELEELKNRLPKPTIPDFTYF